MKTHDEEEPLPALLEHTGLPLLQQVSLQVWRRLVLHGGKTAAEEGGGRARLVEESLMTHICYLARHFYTSGSYRTNGSYVTYFVAKEGHHKQAKQRRTARKRDIVSAACRRRTRSGSCSSSAAISAVLAALLLSRLLVYLHRSSGNPRQQRAVSSSAVGWGSISSTLYKFTLRNHYGTYHACAKISIHVIIT